MALQEAVVEITPDSDFAEVEIEEQAPPVKEEEAPPPVKDEPKPVKEEPQKEDDTEAAEKVAAKAREAEEVEKIKKDRDALGYRVRRMEDDYSKRIQFLEDQLRQERDKIRKREFGDDRDKQLASIAHLKDTDPDLYIREYQRVTDNFHEKRAAEERAAIQTNVNVQAFEAKRRAVEERMTKDFPDIANESSELFVETQRTIMSRYSPEEIVHLHTNAPMVFYDIAAESAARLQVKKLQEEKANATREQRVNGQGVVESKKKTSDSIGLTKEQLAFCKKNGFDPKEYAKFTGAGRK